MFYAVADGLWEPFHNDYIDTARGAPREGAATQRAAVSTTPAKRAVPVKCVGAVWRAKKYGAAAAAGLILFRASSNKKSNQTPKERKEQK